jgi:hypothetical protein
MKKVFFIAVLAIAATTAFALSCTVAWNACVTTNGYPDEGCDAGWDACMEALYG